MGGQLTLRDIANALQVSISTVSKALRDSHEIGEETKKRVSAYAREHHYFPNRMAKSLKEGKTGSIGVVVCSIDNPIVAQMLDGIDKTCTAKGYHIIIMQSKESYLQEKACLQLLHARGIDGLLISPASETPDVNHLVELQETSLPIVLFDRLSNGIETHQVGIDNEASAYRATKHLINNGYTRIAHLSSNMHLSMADERLDGYKKALDEHGIPVNPDFIRYCSYTDRTQLREDIRTAIRQLMQSEKKPDAIFTAGDQITTSSIGIINQLGYRIPDDLALIGFSNTELAGSLSPALSTVYQPAREIGQLAAEKLLGLIKGRQLFEDYETIRLETRIDIRASSRPPQPVP